jgi:hypothetical protein
MSMVFCYHFCCISVIQLYFGHFCCRNQPLPSHQLINPRKGTTFSPLSQQKPLKITRSPPNSVCLLHISRKTSTFAAISQQSILCDSYVIPMWFVCHLAYHTDTPPYLKNRKCKQYEQKVHRAFLWHFCQRISTERTTNKQNIIALWQK